MKSKKERKEEYKLKEIPMGVFQIRNTSSNMILIDNSIDMLSKWNRHRMELKFGTHKNRLLQNDWNKEGSNNFVFEILSELKKDNEEHSNYPMQLKILQNMVMEELNINSENLY